MIYEEYYWTQSEQKRSRMNELTIWAVNKMSNTESNTIGSKTFLRGRATQLVTDIRTEGWRRAAERYRKAVDRWIFNHEPYKVKPSALLLRGI
jgi:hypothetical protein